tara:strand:+ start:3503 stop:3751 length:249 start_codon:yes stop_codon:yes gene_type:complete
MSSFDIFLLLCILIINTYTYIKKNIKKIETFANDRVLNSVDSKTKENRNLINSLFERIVVLEEDLNEDEGEADDFEYQLPDA